MTKRQKWLLASILLWLTMIWCMSAQPGELSASSSSYFKQWLLSLSAGIPQVQLILEQILAVISIRKIAHFMEYAVLSILSYSFFAEYKHERLCKYAGNWALLFCVAAAAVDELHQLHVPGRDGKPSDVLLDTIGAVVGIMLICVLNKILLLRRK